MVNTMVLADWNYAVYFDPEEEPGRNPFGDGFSPRGPKKWNEVNFYGGFLSFPRVDYSENICTTDTAFSGLNPPTTDHQQSPIEVEDGPVRIRVLRSRLDYCFRYIHILQVERRRVHNHHI
jgi:hypothetical protein